MPRQHKGLVMSEDTILAAIAALDAKLTTHDAKFASFDAKFTSLDAKLTTFDARLTTFRVDVLARFDLVENRLTALQDDIAVSMGRADRAHGTAINVRDELRMMSTEVSALTRKT
jgi:hypothetical protein